MPTTVQYCPTRFPSRLVSLSAAGAAILALTGCASLRVEDSTLRTTEIRATVQTDKAALAANIEPLTGVLTLEEAIARALKYNADVRYKAMEQAVAMGTFEVGKYDQLPKLVAAAGYHGRNNDLITRSTDSVTGAPSLAHPFISSSRNTVTSELGFSWSLLDFGQSYYAARQNADRVLIAAERRRKAMHNLVQDVRTAYWRVVAAQKLLPALHKAINDSEAALKNTRQAEQDSLHSPLEPLRYERQLLENLRLLETINQELSTARVELAALTALPFNQHIEVAEPVESSVTAWLEAAPERLEEMALLRNPDLREGMYNARIAQQETRRAMLKLFPGISFNAAYKHSNDSYLIHQNWNEAGAQISFNLLGLLAAPAQMRLADAGVALAEQHRMALQMAVLTQLHLARLQLANAAQQFGRADAIAKVDSRITQHVVNQEQARKQSQADSVAQQTANVLSQLRRYQALSNLQMASSRLQATVGMEPALADPATMPLAALAGTVAQSLKDWEAGKLPDAAREGSR